MVVLLRILGFYNRDGFIWGGVEPGKPLNTPMPSTYPPLSNAFLLQKDRVPFGH